MKETVKIYGLYDPVTGALRYIGKANDAAARLKTHLRDARRRDTPVYRWIRKLARNGMVPNMKVLAECQPELWPSVEREIISQNEGLLNVAEGGTEPFCPPEVRKANARFANSVRRPNVIKAFATFNSTLRSPHISEAFKEKTRGRLAQFKASVARHQANGTMALLDANLGEMYASRQASRA